MEKNKHTQKIIVLSIFLFVLFFSQILLPITVNAVTDTSNKLNWDNPNKNGDNPFKFNTDAVLNPKTMMQVVGCTGIVDRVSSAVTSFASKTINDAERAVEKWVTDIIMKKACESAKAVVISAMSPVPNSTAVPSATALQKAVEKLAECNATSKVQDPQAHIDAVNAKTNDDETKKREECFNGLAYTLAKNQLTAMTRQTINWVNSGFNGNPMYVQNITSLTDSIGKNVFENGITVLANGAFPYSDTFARTAIKNYQTGGLGSNAVNFLDNLTSDLSAFVTDTKSYFNSPDTTELNKIRRQREIEASQAFSNDFSTGGWDAWSALTQRDQNNPLGFTMMASQKLADQLDYQTNVTKDELKTNGGFLDQKVCIKWQLYDANGKALTTKNTLINGSTTSSGINIAPLTANYFVYSDTKSSTTPNHDVCKDWTTTTPGSLIKDKVSNYLGSPERQLEMADTINKSLSDLFTKLIENFRGEGLFGLSQDTINATDSSGGYGVNDGGNYSNISSTISSGYESAYYNNTSGYDSNFDLTRDLGNTYIRKPTRELGTWNAKTNKTSTGESLNVDLGIYNEIAQGYEAPYYYYTVSYPGNTKLFNNGYTGWAEGDRAFWDGTKWQNWKKGQTSPIDTRGVIQVQSDYIVAAKELLKILPGVMPKIGELDYCIPGPNPSYDTISAENGNLFSDFAGTLSSSYTPGAFFKRDSTTYKIATAGTPTYDAYKAIFDNKNEFSLNTDSVFKTVTGTSVWNNLYLNVGKTNLSDKKESDVENSVNTTENDITKNLREFAANYKEMVFDPIYKIMQSQYIEHENFADPVPNTAYVPMINEGYGITKDITSYDEKITNETELYKSDIIQTQQNIGKLNIIKSEVSKIIKTAQDRRDAVLAEKMKPLTKAQYEAKYADCFAEENILYYDSNDIMKNEEVGTERCNNGLDDDLDGLADAKDPDCYKTNTTNTNSTETTPDTEYTPTYNPSTNTYDCPAGYNYVIIPNGTEMVKKCVTY